MVRAGDFIEICSIYDEYMEIIAKEDGIFTVPDTTKRCYVNNELRINLPYGYLQKDLF